MESSSNIRMIVGGKRYPSMDLLHRLSEYLSWNEREFEYAALLVELERCRADSLKPKLRRRPLALHPRGHSGESILAAEKFEVISDPDSFATVQESLERAKVEIETSELDRLPNDTVDLDVDTARKVLKLMEELDDHDDVQKVAANFNIPDEAMAELEQAA